MIRMPRLHSKPGSKYLIVNADDFGYFPEISQGIIECYRAGTVTATSVMANRPNIHHELDMLLGVEGLDVGVHLNLTFGTPVTKSLLSRLPDRRFPGKYWWAVKAPFNEDLRRLVAEEWRAQVSICADHGLEIKFLNSHEHVHMLPRLFPLVQRLAQDFGIKFIRWSVPDWFFSSAPGFLLRNILIKILTLVNASNVKHLRSAPRMLGLSASGRLDMNYLRSALATMSPGDVCELMCHPGRMPEDESIDHHLLAYHQWMQEYDLLTGDAFKTLLGHEGVCLLQFSDIC
jgi:predicted glycoside hydrolase/deacetylase ChbG (UPF0249 family)